jgi:hypothetical protein
MERQWSELFKILVSFRAIILIEFIGIISKEDKGIKFIFIGVIIEII